MPLTALHLLSLKPDTDVESCLRALRSALASQLILASRPRHVVVSPSHIDKDELVVPRWDLMLLLLLPPPPSPSPSPSQHCSALPLPASLQQAIRAEYVVAAGVPSRLLSTYAQRNAALRRTAASVPLSDSLLDRCRARDSSQQSLELSASLLQFMDELSRDYSGPVTMLNLLHFHRDGKPKYYEYGQRFKAVAGKRGGDAKLVGNVVASPRVTTLRTAETAPATMWHEISIVHYPSIRHFCDMLASEEYQAINAEHRLAALKDTFLLCTVEDDSAGAKL